MGGIDYDVFCVDCSEHARLGDSKGRVRTCGTPELFLIWHHGHDVYVWDENEADGWIYPGPERRQPIKWCETFARRLFNRCQLCHGRGDHAGVLCRHYGNAAYYGFAHSVPGYVEGRGGSFVGRVELLPDDDRAELMWTAVQLNAYVNKQVSIDVASVPEGTDFRIINTGPGTYWPSMWIEGRAPTTSGEEQEGDGQPSTHSRR